MSQLRDLGGSAVRSILERVGRGVGKVQERKPLPSDLLESDDEYLVVFDAAGAEQSDVQVRFVGGEVQVRVDRFREFHEGFEMRFPGRGLSLSGSAGLPEDASVDPEAAGATLSGNGTLEVRIPKTGEATDVPVTEKGEPAGDDDESTAGSNGAGEDDGATARDDDGATAASDDDGATAGDSDDADDE